MDNPQRLMPDRLNPGHHANTTMCHPMGQWQNSLKDQGDDNPQRLRTVMGYPVPDWQRPLVWTEHQQIRFMESAWLGLNLGTYAYNQLYGSEYDMLLIDGQQRLWALQRYLMDDFLVFGYHYSEITDVDRRFFEMGTIFACYITTTDDEVYLKGYYNLMNFGGTPHTEDQRA